MSKALTLVLLSFLALALVPTAAAGQPCTTPPKQIVDQVVWAAGCTIERLPLDAIEPDVGTQEVDLTSLTNCPGPWGHEERTQVGPVVIVTYECDDGGA